MKENQSSSFFLKKKGLQLISQNQFEKAKNYFLSALIITPNDLSTRMLLATTYFFLGDKEQALRIMSLNIKPGHFPLVLKHKGLPPDCCLENVYLETYRFTPFTTKVSYYASISYRNLKNHPLLSLYKKEDFLLIVPNSQEVIHTPCVLLGGETNYFLWMIRILPKLKQYFSKEAICKLPLVVNKDLLPFQKESLKYLGIPEEKLMKVEPNRVYTCSKLFALHRIQDEDVLFLRDQLMPSEPEDSYERLFLFRGKSYRRNLLNEEELFERLEPMGFKKIEPGKLPLKEQIKLFANAKIIVGTHDAGFANLIFVNEGTPVLELTHKNNPMKSFEMLSKLVNFPLQRYHGDIDSSVKYKNLYSKQMANFTVDIDEVMGLVHKMINDHCL